MVYIGIDLGGTNIAVGVVSEAGSILAETSAKTLAEKRSLMGNHLQPAAERILERLGIKPDPYFTPETKASAPVPKDAVLCGAGPTYFSVGEDGPYRTIL